MSDPAAAPAGPEVSRQQIGDALGALGRLAEVHDRPELSEAVTTAIGRLSSSRFRVVVMGEYKRGKSSLINALVDAPICAVDDDIATAARLEIAFADAPAARCWSRESSDADVIAADIPIGEAAAASTRETTTLVRVGIPRRLLRGGLVLVDTPGVGGIDSATSIVTASSLADAHAVLFVSDTSQELTRPEASALRDATERCARVIFVETKIDMYPHWRDIVDADRKHLHDLGLDVQILPVSSVLRSMALSRESAEMNAESGYPDLVSLIASELMGSAEHIAIDGAMHTARRVYDRLRAPLVAEIELLETSEDTTAARDAVEAAKRQIAEFKERVAGWQQVLGDGSTDLAAAVDGDLRDRIRALVAESEETLDEVDPDEVWHEFEPTLYRQTAAELDANLELLRDQADALSARVASSIADDEGRLDSFLGELVTEGEFDVEAKRKEEDSGSSGERAQRAFKAGYGGAMPIMAVGGMALGVLGLGTLVLPLAAVAGVMAGRKALTDERERALNQRRQQAKVAVKKYTDQAMSRAAAERKQQQRTVQRLLRDHCKARVKELAATYQQALERADGAAKATEQERRHRLADARDELGRIEQVVRNMAAAR